MLNTVKLVYKRVYPTIKVTTSYCEGTSGTSIIDISNIYYNSFRIWNKNDLTCGYDPHLHFAGYADLKYN